MKTITPMSIRSKKIIDMIAIAESAPVLPSSKVLKIANGRLATIPEKIIIEIPLPKPFSVICSPNHIKNIVPDVIVITADTWKKATLPKVGSTVSDKFSIPLEIP